VPILDLGWFDSEQPHDERSTGLRGVTKRLDAKRAGQNLREALYRSQKANGKAGAAMRWLSAITPTGAARGIRTPDPIIKNDVIGFLHIFLRLPRIYWIPQISSKSSFRFLLITPISPGGGSDD